jgi:hypothetical protein
MGGGGMRAGSSSGAGSTADDALIKKAHAIHDKVIARHPQRHQPTNFTAEVNYTQRLGPGNLPKMVEGI